MSTPKPRQNHKKNKKSGFSVSEHLYIVGYGHLQLVMKHFNYRSTSSASLFYLLISSPTWAALCIPKAHIALNAIYLSASLFTSIALFTRLQPWKKSNLTSLPQLVQNSFLFITIASSTLLAPTLTIATLLLQQISLFVLIQTAWHSRTKTAQPTNKTPFSYMHKLSHDARQQLDQNINMFLPNLIEKNGLCKQKPSAHNKKKRPSIMADTNITTANPQHPNFTSTGANSQQQSSLQMALATFKESVFLKTQYLLKLNSTIKTVLNSDKLYQLQQQLQSSTPSKHDRPLEHITQPLQQLLSVLPQEKVSSPTKILYDTEQRCAFSHQKPAIPLSIVVEDHTSGRKHSITADLNIFADILEHFCDKISLQGGEEKKIHQAALHLTQTGRQDLGQKLTKLAAIQKKHGHKSNTIYKCIQLWPKESPLLVESLLQHGIECGSKSTNQKTCSQLAHELELTATEKVLEKHDRQMPYASPAKKSSFRVQSTQAHQWPGIEKSLLDPTIKIISIGLNSEIMREALSPSHKQYKTPESSPQRMSAITLSPFNDGKLQQQSLYNNRNLIESLTQSASPKKVKN